MRLLPAEGNGVAFYPLGAGDYRERQPACSSTGALFDVEFEISRDITLFNCRIADAGHIDPAASQRGFERDTVAVGADPVSLNSVGSGKGRRSEEAAAEARSFLVGPVDQPHGEGRFACPVFRTIVFRDGTQTSSPASSPRQPSSQPPFGTESRWLPSTSAFGDAP